MLQYTLWGSWRTLLYVCSGVTACNTALISLLLWSLQVSAYSAVLRYVDCSAADHTSSDIDERQVHLDRNHDEGGTAVWVSQQHLQFKTVCLFSSVVQILDKHTLFRSKTIFFSPLLWYQPSFGTKLL
jgi:hypothetical protein